MDTWQRHLTRRGKKQNKGMVEKDEEGCSLLADWDISRDAPILDLKFQGRKISTSTFGLTHLIGYYASLINWCCIAKKDANEYIEKETKVELIHFIGKDILYFHALFWPAMLHFSGFPLPTSLYAHGFLTINGKK